MQGVAREFDGKVRCVAENFGSSELAERFGIKRYPAVFIEDVLIAKPKDFGFFGESGSQGEGRYTPWRTQESQDRFEADLRRLVGQAVRGELSSADGVDASKSTELTRMPDFELEDLDGNTVGTRSLTKTVTVVDFWATWCPPCIKALPSLRELQEAHPDDLQVVGVVVESPRDAVVATVEKFELPFANVMGTPELAVAFGDIVAVPTVFVFDAGGRLVKTFYGAPPELKQELATLVSELIDGSSPDPGGGDWVDVPVDSSRWERSGVEPVRVEHLGRDAMKLQGGRLSLPDGEFLDGEIEFSLASTGERGFAGAFWRQQDEGNFEYFYLRPHRAGHFDSCQYTPVFNGSSGWQLYTEGATAIDFAANRWLDVRLRVLGDVLQVFVDSDEPQLVVRTRRDAAAGGLGLVAANFAPVYFTGFRYRSLDEAAPPAPALPSREGMVTNWSVSTPFAESSLADVHELPASLLEERRWTDVRADAAGLVDLARLSGTSEASDTCLARLTLEADAAATVSIDFGFSDRARVYHDGRLVFAGDDTYQTRDERFLGTIGLHDQVVLRLHEGANDVIFAVSESFGGWGLMGSVRPTGGVRVGT